VVISPFFFDQTLKELVPKGMESTGASVNVKGPSEQEELEVTLTWDPEPL